MYTIFQVHAGYMHTITRCTLGTITRCTGALHTITRCTGHMHTTRRQMSTNAI